MIKHSEIIREEESCLMVLINQIYYGIKTSTVKEIIELPELKSLPNFPSFFSGVLDYRGITVPIVDAKLALGYDSEDYTDSNVLVVIKEGEELFGVILPSLFDIQNLQLVKEAHFSQFIVEARTKFPIIKEVSKYKDNLVFLFDMKALLGELNAIFSNEKKSLQEEVATTSVIGEALHRHVPHVSFISKVPENLRELFAERAKRLSEKYTSADFIPGTISITILKILEKNFAIESEKIKEFCYITDYAPIPTHEKLLGFMNLRGSILPLADIWYLLHGERLKIKPLCKVLVLEFVDGILGFVVEEADRVVSVEVSAVSDLPFSGEGQEEQFITRAVKIENQVIGILDTERLIQAIL